MKFQPNKQYTTIAIYAFLVIAAVLLLYEGINNVSTLMRGIGDLFQFIQPVVYGFVFAYLLNPLLRTYDDRLLPYLTKGKMSAKTRRTVGLLLTYPTVLIFLSLFIYIIVPQLATSIRDLFGLFPSYMVTLQRWYNELMASMQELKLFSEGTELETLLGDPIKAIMDALSDLLTKAYEYLTDMMPHILSASARVTSGIVNFLLGIIISIYFLFDREKLFAQLKKICHAVFSDQTVALFYDIAVDANRIFSGFVIGKIIDSLIIGVICFVGISILRMPYAVLISVIIGITNVIPYFGPFIGAIPSVLIIFIVSPIKALWFAIFILLLQQFDGNILGPKILGETTGLSALWVVFAIMLFSGIFGMLGMFIGVPLFALLYNLLSKLVVYLLKQKNKPTSTRSYDSDQNKLLR